jgi:hypothetical protein
VILCNELGFVGTLSISYKQQAQESPFKANAWGLGLLGDLGASHAFSITQNPVSSPPEDSTPIKLILLTLVNI